MKTEEQIRGHLDAVRRDVQRMYAQGLMTHNRQVLTAQIVGTLLWVLGEGSDATDTIIAEMNERFEAFFGGVAKEGKYGHLFATKKKFHPDEPVFVLRATDRNAPGTLEDYVYRCQKDGCTFDHIDAAEKHLERIRGWQDKNPSLVKKPD